MVSEKRMKNSVMKIIGSIFFNYEGGLFESFHLTKYKPLHNMYIYAIHFDKKGEIPFFPEYLLPVQNDRRSHGDPVLAMAYAGAAGGRTIQSSLHHPSRESHKSYTLSVMVGRRRRPRSIAPQSEPSLLPAGPQPNGSEYSMFQISPGWEIADAYAILPCRPVNPFKLRIVCRVSSVMKRTTYYLSDLCVCQDQGTFNSLKMFKQPVVSDIKSLDLITSSSLALFTVKISTC